MNEQASNGKLYLEHIAKRWGKTVKEALYTLISHDIIYTPASNVTFTSKSTGYQLFEPATDMPVPEINLQIIYSNGSWSGETVTIRKADEGETRITEVNFKDEITITIDNLFVYEYDLLTFEDKFPELLIKSEEQEVLYSEPCLLEAYKILNVDPYAATTALITNNYLLIGILLEYIIGNRRGLKFTNQKDLITDIVNKSKFTDSDLNKKFPAAKKVKKSIEKIFDEALDQLKP